MSSPSPEFNALTPDLPRGRRWGMALILGSLTAFGPMTIDMYLPSLPTLTRDLQTTPSLAQLSLTACLLGIAFGQLFVGPLSDAKGRRTPLMIGLSIYTIASILCSFAPSIGLLIALRFIQGAAGSSGIVISRAMARDFFTGTELTKFFSLLMLVNGAAPILAPVSGGLILKYTSWHGVFVVLCIIGILMFLSITLVLPETLHPTNRSKGGVKHTLVTYWKLFRDPIFMGYVLCQALVYAAMFAYISGSPYVIQDIYGASPQLFSLFFAINGFGIIIASQTTGRLVERVGELRFLKIGLSIASVASILLLVAILLHAHLIFILIPLFFVVSSVGIVSTTCFSLAMESQGKSAGSAAALLGMLPFVAGAIAAPLVGLGGGKTAFPMGLIIMICDIGAISVFLLFVRRNLRSR